MLINNWYDIPAHRAPRAKVVTDGREIPGIIDVEVTSCNYFQADTFRATFALNASPDFGLSWWGDTSKKQILLDIQMSLDAGQSFQSMLIGQVDHISVALHLGTVEVDGRDMSSLLIDAKTDETFLNKTSSQIAEILAERHGLQADISETSTLSGRFYSEDHDRMNTGSWSRATTEWNLLCSLAQHEQFDVYVTGQTLHFHPATDPNSDPYVVLWDPKIPWSNATALDVERAMTVARDVVVVVRSWNSQQAQSITKTAGVKSDKSQIFSFIVPNLTEEAAQSLANRYRDDITQHERLFDFTMPADLLLQPRMMLQLQGTGSDWDQSFFTDVVSRRMDSDGGFVMSVRTKNHSPQSTVLAA